MKKQIDNILGGSRKSEVGSPKWEPGFGSLFNHCSNLFAPLSTFTQEVGSRKSEVGSLKGTPVSDSLFLIFYFLFPGKGKENKEHRITNNEYRISNNESGSQKFEVGSPKPEPGFDNLLNHCSNLPAPLSPLAKGDEIRPLVAGSEGVVTPANVGKEKKEHRITNNEYRITNIEYRIRKAEDGIRNLTSNDTSTSFLSPSPFGEGRGEANNESGSFLGNLVSDSLFPVERPGRLIIYFLFPEKGKRPETTPGRVKIAPGLRKMTHGRVKTTPELKKMTQGRVKTTPGIKKMTQGRVKTTPEFKKMTQGWVKIASGIKKMTHGRVKIAPGMRKMTPGRVEYAPGPLPAPHGTISPYAFTAPYGVGTPERPEMGLIKGENKEQRISNNECRITNNESGSRETEVGRPKLEEEMSYFLTGNSNLLAPLSPLAKGDEIRPLVAGTEGVVTPANVGKEKKEHRITNNESGSFSGTPVSDSLFLIFYFLFPGKGKENKEHRITNNEYRISNNEAGSQKSEVRSSSGTPVSYFLFLISYFLFPGKGKENNEYPISNNEYRIRKAEDACLPDRQGSRNLTSNDTSTSFLSPFRRLADGWGEAKYKTLSRLPQESGFNSGDCPGAAAITIFYSFYSSPRVSPNFAGTTQKNLPVANQKAFHQGSIVPLFRGTSPGYPGRRGYLPFHRNLMFEALNQKGGMPMS